MIEDLFIQSPVPDHTRLLRLQARTVRSTKIVYLWFPESYQRTRSSSLATLRCETYLLDPRGGEI